MSLIGPRRPTVASQHVGSYLGDSDRGAGPIQEDSRDPYRNRDPQS
jgi:hypothetical protein